MEATMGKETRDWVVIENEGHKIFGVIHRPPVENPPVVVIMHGFASCKIGTNRSWVCLAEALSKAGIAVMRFDFRGAGDSEGSLSQMTPEWYVSDALAVTAYLEGENFDRIGYFGSSLGGAVSVQAAALHKNIQSIALWAPVASGELWVQDFLMQNPEHVASSNLEELLTSYHGVKLNPHFKEQFVQMNAYEKLHELSDVPLLHFHGENDQTLSLIHQNAYRSARAGSRAPTQFVTFPNAGHTLAYEPIFPDVVQQTVDWFQKTL